MSNEPSRYNLAMGVNRPVYNLAMGVTTPFYNLAMGVNRLFSCSKWGT